ncbi:hypothetical protein KKH23_04150 [Patescibacteria group bacterium]|nr:hypothetical protein [Patescibacteria group bacterium]MBU0776995.1 hypothetical protein [Patescibacteria group bacterium]MBU0846359.1 hypothetical protein [Patescibacteria group bacterium]MBU0923024.1 hypothetical protein [Patescibacteria group bacterium]MBU1844608.1 hypothetical protein [Patescibacteria group bacterium]
MSKKEQFRKASRNIAEEITKTGKQPTTKEVMETTHSKKKHALHIVATAKGYVYSDRAAAQSSALNTGDIPGLKPVCSLEDISKPKDSE